MNALNQRYKFLDELKSLPFVNEIWLFGSRARGDHQDRSDIDIAILASDSLDDIQWSKINRIIENADTLLQIDCVRFAKGHISPELYKNILIDKKVLYMKEYAWADQFYTLGNAINRLKEILQDPQLDTREYMRDATIQRFEFTIELCWKVLKKILSYEKVECNTPRDTLSKAFQYKLIDHEEIWLKMLDDRNNTSHAYKEENAILIFEHIKSYFFVFEETYKSLKEKYDL